MKINWQLMRDLIRTDCITMKGGRNNNILILAAFGGFMGIMGFCISPLAGLYVPFLLGGFFVPTLFNNEMKYHSGRLWCLLPIERKDLVNARFLLSTGLYAAVNLAFYLLMLLALRLRLWEHLDMGADIIGMMAKRMGFSRLGLFNLAYFSVISFGLVLMSGSLRRYFRDPEKFSAILQAAAGLRKSSRKELLLGGLILGASLLWALIVTGILPLGPAAALLVQIFLQIAQAANGLLLGILFLSASVFHTVFQYISTQIEYDQREL